MNEFINILNKFKTTNVISKFEFKVYSGKIAWCDVACWQHLSKIYVLFIEVENNPGMSVTNGSEQLLTQFYNIQLCNFKREECFFFETQELTLEDLEYLDIWDEKLIQIDHIIPVWDNGKVSSVNWRTLIDNKKRIFNKMADKYEDETSS